MACVTPRPQSRCWKRASSASSSVPRRSSDPELVDELAQSFPGRVAVGLDARGRDVSTHGWTAASGLDLVDLARRFDRPGVGALVVTEISRDGMLQGPDLEQLSAVLGAVTVPSRRERRRLVARRPACPRRAAGRRAADSRARSPGPRSTKGASPPKRGSPRARCPCDPVPRRRRGPRRERRAVHRAARRRGSGRARGALRRGRRRRAGVPRHHGIVRRPRHDGAHGRARRRRGVHPVHRRRRACAASRTCAACCARAPTRSR